MSVDRVEVQLQASETRPPEVVPESVAVELVGCSGVSAEQIQQRLVAMVGDRAFRMSSTSHVVRWGGAAETLSITLQVAGGYSVLRMLLTDLRKFARWLADHGHGAQPKIAEQHAVAFSCRVAAARCGCDADLFTVEAVTEDIRAGTWTIQLSSDVDRVTVIVEPLDGRPALAQVHRQRRAED